MPGVLPPPGAAWKERRDRALADTTLRGAVARTTHNLATQRIAGYVGYPRGEELRERAQAAKRASVARLDELLIELTRNVEAHGGHVIRAAGPDDVARYVLDVARRRGAQRVVKSKSMATEEVDLNLRLETAGMHVRETDLGEYIIQLAHERPSHILAPAAHKTRGQIKVLFEAEAAAQGVEPPTDESTPALHISPHIHHGIDRGGTESAPRPGVTDQARASRPTRATSSQDSSVQQTGPESRRRGQIMHTPSSARRGVARVEVVAIIDLHSGIYQLDDSRGRPMAKADAAASTLDAARRAKDG